MSEQHRMNPGPLLDNNGNLAEPGYAFSLVKRYDRKLIKAHKCRIKEWDYYYVGNKDDGLALTVADNGYMWLAGITILQFKKEGTVEDSQTYMGAFPMGKLNLPSDSRLGDIDFSDSKKGYSFRFFHEGAKRHLICEAAKVGPNAQPFHCDILLSETNGHSMVIATPFKQKHHFYYNQKINNQAASGYAKLGELTIDFNKDSFGVLDWGRGVWSYRNTWYWSSLNSSIDGVPFGWNLGYGFGDTKAASENMLFIGENVYKLDDVRFDIPMGPNGKDEFMKPWKFRSAGGDINAVFTPKYNRHSDTNVLVIRSNQSQVFGTFTGYVLADGHRYDFIDLPGFAEKVFNKW